MRLILPGLPKTGSRTIARGLLILGYETCDTLQHFANFRNLWYNIKCGNATVADLRRAYRGVDAVAGIPVCYYWEEMFEAFPEAKVNRPVYKFSTSSPVHSV